MKRFDGWLTFAFSVLSLLFLILSLFYPYPIPLLAAAVCWGFGFSWFIRLGRLARGKIRRLYGATFFLLCADLLICLLFCIFLAFFVDNACYIGNFLI